MKKRKQQDDLSKMINLVAKEVDKWPEWLKNNVSSILPSKRKGNDI